MSKCIVLKSNRSFSVEDLPELGDLQEAVGGYIQQIRLPALDEGLRTFVMYLNDDGKLLGLPRNPLATKVCFRLKAGLHPKDFVVGDVVFSCLDSEGEPADISEEAIKRLQELLVNPAR